jgi:hypothetical protein
VGTDSSSDEIDLQDALIKFLLLVKKYSVIVVVFPVLGLVGGYLYGKVAQKFYQSKMLINSLYLTEAYVDVLGKNFNEMHQFGGDSLLAKSLSLPVSEVSKISSIEIEAVGKEAPQRSFAVLSVEAMVTDPAIFPDLEKGIISYLENNAFSKTRIDQRRKALAEIIRNTNEEVQILEALRTDIAKGTFYERIKGNVSFDLTMVNSKILEMTERVISLQNDLINASGIQVVEGFTMSTKPVTPNRNKLMWFGILIGLIAAAMLIAILEIYPLIRKAQTKQ